MTKEFRNAAANGEYENVEKYLKTPGIDINATSSNGNTALIWAAKRFCLEAKQSTPDQEKCQNYLKIIGLLLKHGANDLKANNSNETIYTLKELTGNAVLFRAIFSVIFSHELRKIEAQATNDWKFNSFIAKLIEYFFLQLTNLNILSHFSQMAPGQTIRILSFGCGFCLDMIALLKVFNSRGIHVEYVGVDIAKKELNSDVAELIHKSCNDKAPSSLTTHVADATDITRLQQILGDKKFDLALLSNGNFITLDTLSAFYKMLCAFPLFLKPDAKLLCTYGAEAEYDVMNGCPVFINQLFTPIGTQSQLPIMLEREEKALLQSATETNDPDFITQPNTFAQIFAFTCKREVTPEEVKLLQKTADMMAEGGIRVAEMLSTGIRF